MYSNTSLIKCTIMKIKWIIMPLKCLILFKVLQWVHSKISLECFRGIKPIGYTNLAQNIVNS